MICILTNDHHEAIYLIRGTDAKGERYSTASIATQWAIHCERAALPGLSLCLFSPRLGIALRSTSKMTAVDHPNNSTPFIAVTQASASAPAESHRRNQASSSLQRQKK